MAGERVAHGGKAGANQFFHRLPLHVGPDIATLQPGHVKQVHHHRPHPPGLLQHGGYRLIQRRGQRRFAALHGFGHADQAGQRGAQVMGDSGQQ
ncbi:hypothetical protein D3C72_1793360 [compost metagenome]